MGPDVLRRVRWGNVALTAAVVAALAAAIAWPRLAPAPSRLPSDSAQPVVDEGPRRQETPAPQVKPLRPREKPKPRRHARKPRARPRKHTAKPHRAPPPSPARMPPRVIGTPPPPHDAGSEFGFER